MSENKELNNLMVIGQSIKSLSKDSDHYTIIEEKDKFSVYIRKNKDVLPWKDFNKNMAVSVEYNLEY